MKEKYKYFGKARLKCFQDDRSNTNRTEVNYILPQSPIDDENISLSPGEKNADLYKSLLNEVPCTSNEKGTMTDPSLQKKGKQSVNTNESATSNCSLKNVLQSVSKNKADNKVPLVILSKSPSSSISSKSNKEFILSESKDMNVFDFLPSEFESSEGNTDLDSSQKREKYLSNKKSSNESLSSSDFDDLNISNSSPDFQGFTSPIKSFKGKTDGSNEKVCRKKLFTTLDKELISPESEVTTLDHPYSHGSQEKVRYNQSSSETSLAGCEYQRFVNRSVFGSPSLSKNPPDIMLHNDKINILRQMSQVFNDEKNAKSNSTKSIDSCKEAHDKTKMASNSQNSELNKTTTTSSATKTIKAKAVTVIAAKSVKVTTLATDVEAAAAAITTVTTTETPAATTTTTTTTTATTTVTTTTPAIKTIKMKTVATQSAMAIATDSLHSVTTVAVPSTTTATTTTVASTKAIKTMLSTSAASLTVVTTSEEKVSPSLITTAKEESKDSISSRQSDIISSVSKGGSKVDEKENPIRKKYMTRRSSKLDQHESENKNNPVHLVSSYSVDRDESIQVESYHGVKGEEVDVIDGFTILSFKTEAEMMNFLPLKSKRKLKKKNQMSSKTFKVSSSQSEQKVVHSKAKDKIDDDISAESLIEDAQNNKSNSDNIKTVVEDNTILRLQESIKPHQKMIESSAFASNDLDQYLTEHSELKSSFAIPKCSATEGVTKFDETGKHIPSLQEHSSAVSRVEPKPVHLSEPITLVPRKPLPSTIAKKPLLKPPISVSALRDIENAASIFSKKRKSSLSSSGGSDLFVKRGGNLLPLSSVFKRSNSENVEKKDTNMEMIYLYHGGRLITLGGSITRLDPSNPGSVKVTIAVPRDHRRLVKHSQRVSSRKVKAVEINEDLAKFALSALKTPTKDEKHVDIKPQNETKEEEKSYLKPSKENILDILAAKFSIDKGAKWDDKSESKISSETISDSQSGSETKPEMETKIGGDSVSKIKWNQDDILKKKDSTSNLEPSKGFKKNINRFPSLSREMKRLNMNFVTYKESDEETEDKSETKPNEPCTNKHCTMGCVCDSLRCRKKVPEHCGKADCMFNCSCTVESLKEGQRSKVPSNMVSIFNADRENGQLALKEKDFKKTIVQTESDMFMIGAEKKKRDIRIPQRYRDTNIWKSPSPPLSLMYDCINEEDKANKENVPILPSSYKHYIKDFSINIPWYDVNGASIWCMNHSCYDCSCLTDSSFYIGTDQDLSEDEDVMIVEDSVHDQDNYLPRLPTDTRILCFNLLLKAFGGTASSDRGKWTLKHWIHNSNMHCARSCGYNVKEKITKDVMNNNMKDGYSLPLPKTPFIMGITLKNKTESSPRKNVNEGDCQKAVFYDGLGPGLSLSSLTHSDEIFSKYAENRQLSSICLKSLEIESRTAQEVTSKPVPTLPDLGQNKEIVDHVKDTHREPNSEYSQCTEGDEEEIVGKEENKKCFSLYEMIQEEEKRGELELDLTAKEEGKAILISESRFRKLINMNIIGIIGLNKLGRCIISTVKSAEDLIKMQRLQQLISNNTIDVGPNMREIFAPSSQLDQKVRYVMIRCDVSGRWEIVGVVQRKTKENENFVSPKPKRQKTKPALPSLLMNHLKYIPNAPTSQQLSDESTEGASDADALTEAISLDSTSNINSNEKTSNVAEPKTMPNTVPKTLPITTSNQVEKLILDDGENDSSLPCISSVISGDDPYINELIDSPPKVPSSIESDPSNYIPTVEVQSLTTKTTIVSAANYVLNQRSEKIFGLKSVSPGGTMELQSSQSGTTNNVFKGSFKFDSNSKLLFYPKVVASGNPQILDVPLVHPKVPQIIGNNPQIRMNRPQIRAGIPHMNPAVTVGSDKIKMLLVPSTTSPGKSVLIPTISSAPVNYSWIVRGQNDLSNTSTGISSQTLPYSLGVASNSKVNIPMSFTMATAKQIPQVQTSSSRLTLLANPKTQNSASKKIKIGSETAVQSISASTSLGNLITQGSEKLNIPCVALLPNSVSSSSSFSQSSSLFNSGFPINSDPTHTNAGQFNTGTELACGGSGSQSSPDVTCLNIIRHDRVTAIDLMIKFKSVKLNWLSGTIKKGVLLNIFKMSKKINAPVSLSAKNDSLNQNAFLGMHHFAYKDDTAYPILILGTKFSSVLTTAKLDMQELFQSNYVKYLIKEDEGNMSSYTYDWNGENLIKIASKSKDVGVIQTGFGEKFPIEQLREPLNGADFMPNVRWGYRHSGVEEIVISDSDDDEKSKNKKEMSETLSNTGSVLPKLLPIAQHENKLIVNEDGVITVANSGLTSSVSTTKDGVPLNLKRKFDVGATFSSSSKGTGFANVNSYIQQIKNKHVMQSAPTNTFKLGSFTQRLANKPVLKIPNPFRSNKIDEASKLVEKNFKNEEIQLLDDENIFSKDKESSKNNSLANPVKSKLSSQVGKKPASWGDSLNSNKELCRISTLANMAKNQEGGSLFLKKGPFRIKCIEKTSSKPAFCKNTSYIVPPSTSNSQTPPAMPPSTTSIQIPPSAENLSQDIADGHLDSSADEVCLNLSQETSIHVEGDSEESVTSVLTSQEEIDGTLLDTKNTTSFKRKTNDIDRPCPASKKRFLTQSEHVHSTPSTPDHSSRLSHKVKAKSCSPLPKKCSPSANRNIPSSPTSQEFQQVFSGAPQFWLMDNTEKHNTLERIRRKGLAKMLENLYTKATETPQGPLRLPPKHVVLKESEKVIMELRAKDVKLAKLEIGLRERKSQLLNKLSDIMKDCDEDVQKQLEHWISSNINNPSAKIKFEESWKPQNVVFDDEQIFSTTCGQLTVSGADITSYFAMHTAGFTPTKSPPKFKAVKSQLSRKKFPFHLQSPPKHSQHSLTLKNKLTNVLKTRKPFHTPPISHSVSLENLNEIKEGSSKGSGSATATDTSRDSDADIRWIDLMAPSGRELQAKKTSSDDDSSSCSDDEKDNSEEMVIVEDVPEAVKTGTNSESLTNVEGAESPASTSGR